MKIYKEYGVVYKRDIRRLIQEAMEKTSEYKRKYQKEGCPSFCKLKIGDKLWYKNTGDDKSKLSPMWETKARVKEVLTNAYKLVGKNGKEWISNQRKVKARKVGVL